jgi:tungstate transport system substrate-binding protein
MAAPLRSWSRNRSAWCVSLLLLALLTLTGCAAEQPAPERLILASTTSTEDSGLFTHLLPAFESAHPEFHIAVVAVGTGEALEMGKRGDADVVLVHAPEAESLFVAQGYGEERREVMYNDFVIVGPEGDPASVRGLADPTEALARIAASRAPFVSRGDDSGTHKRELALWKLAGLTPAGGWYLVSGLGMGEVLRLASERRGYTLTDRATYLFLKGNLSLDVLVEGDARLRNIYGVIPVRGSAHSAGARAFMEWITGPEGQARIGEYGVERFGRSLFIPSARTR